MNSAHRFSAMHALALLAFLALLITFIPPTILAAPPKQGPVVYYVQYRDTLFSIAQRFGTTVPAIMAANGLTSYYIYVGQRLLIPIGTPTPYATPSGFTCKYSVAYRDTLYSIAYRYKTSAYTLMQANYLYSPYIYVGQQLNVPCVTPTPAPFPIYTVVQGDNLFRIAIKYSTSIYAIALVNGIPNPNLIFVGQNLVIPYPNTVVWPPVPTVTPSPTFSGTGTATPTPTATATATGSQTVTSQTYVVIMQSTVFVPATQSVPRGSIVLWQNFENTAHTVTSGTPGNPTGTFSSGQLALGQSFSFTFNSTGTFPYYCENHPTLMTGTITVQ